MTPNWFLNYGSHIIEHNSLETFPKGCFGFIYKITHIDSGRYYIGKKSMEHNVKRKIGKKEKALFEGRGRKPSFETVKKPSGWEKYWGSSKEFLSYVKEEGEEKFTREILHFTFNKRQHTYLEVKTQFSLGVLEDELSFNDNIGGRYFKKDLVV
jgi:hypothetical protein